jgi:hypothetical protein
MPNNFKDLFPIFVSTTALTLSAVTLYLNLFRSAKIEIIPGDRVAIGYEADGVILFHLNMTFVNRGAQPGVVLSMLGEIEDLSTQPRQSLFDWRMFFASKAFSRPGEKLADWFEFGGWVEAIIVPPRSAVSEYIGFRTRDPFFIRKSRYCLIFRADTDSSRQAVLSHRHVFEVQVDEEEQLMEFCRADETGVRAHNLQLSLRKESPQEAEPYTAAKNDGRVLAALPRVH